MTIIDAICVLWPQINQSNSLSLQISLDKTGILQEVLRINLL